MGRRGFTLVELMVVVAIIGLLVAVVAPSVHSAVAVARATICRSNLHQIGEGFAIHWAESRRAGTIPDSYYPRAMRWPTIPYDACPSPELFLCPEAPEGVEAKSAAVELEALLPRIHYVHPHRGYDISFDTAMGLGEMLIGRRDGADEHGRYIEIGLDDNSRVTQQYMDNDGHDGIIRFYENDNGRTYAKLMKYSCTERNCVLMDGEPLFPDENNNPNADDYGWLGPGTSKNAMEVDLMYAPTIRCSYGMTIGAEQFTFPSRKIVVLDYDAMQVDRADPEWPRLLRRAARHLGRLNVLMADGGVERFGPTAIDPLLPGGADLWRP